jgi:serine-type D-Ala-D-Ala endopeptidase (penicillin-binding protein 7)
MNFRIHRFMPRHLIVLGLVLVAFVAQVGAQEAASTAAAPVASADKAVAKRAPSKVARKTAAGKKSQMARRDAQGKRVHASTRRPMKMAVIPSKPSYGQLAGLHQPDPLDLKSSVALVVDQDTKEVLFNKNVGAVLPIASLTKLMTGMVISESNLDMAEMVTITAEDVDTEKGSRSRLKVGTKLTRGELLHLALMSSENRAAHALGRTHPEGLQTFVQKMNAKAKLLGMNETHYVEPTGLSSKNQSSARDLAVLTDAASQVPVLRELTTSPSHRVYVGNRPMQYNNTNRLTLNPLWDIGVQKTGYISEAGQCLVMQAKVAGRKLIMVFLDSAGKLSRVADAERVRRWVEAGNANHSVQTIPSPAAVIRVPAG